MERMIGRVGLTEPLNFQSKEDQPRSVLRNESDLNEGKLNRFQVGASCFPPGGDAQPTTLSMGQNRPLVKIRLVLFCALEEQLDALKSGGHKQRSFQKLQ